MNIIKRDSKTQGKIKTLVSFYANNPVKILVFILLWNSFPHKIYTYIKSVYIHTHINVYIYAYIIYCHFKNKTISLCSVPFSPKLGKCSELLTNRNLNTWNGCIFIVWIPRKICLPILYCWMSHYFLSFSSTPVLKWIPRHIQWQTLPNWEVKVSETQIPHLLGRISCPHHVLAGGRHSHDWAHWVGRQRADWTILRMWSASGRSKNNEEGAFVIQELCKF